MINLALAPGQCHYSPASAAAANACQWCSVHPVVTGFCFRHDLQQRGRPDRDLPREGPVMRGDQQDGRGYPGRKDSHRDGTGKPVSLCTRAIASKAQTACTKRHDHLTKLTWDWRTMMRCRRASGAIFKRGDDFTLCSLLTFSLR
jgi:hypothetical protein